MNYKKYQKKCNKLQTKMIDICLSRDISFSISYSKQRDFEVKINDVYGNFEINEFHVQDTNFKKALKKTLKYLKEEERKIV